MREDLKHLTPRERYVRRVFDAIAVHYDAFNLVASAGMLRLWQRALAARTGLSRGDHAIDVCAGTGQLTTILARQVWPGGRVVGIDFSPVMLDRAGTRLSRTRWGGAVQLVEANALEIPSPDGQFGAATMGFALRNIPDVQRAFDEMARVVRPGGRVLILELSRPPSPWVARPYSVYLYRILPLLGRVVERLTGAGDLRPYSYLPHSLTPLPDPPTLAAMMERSGLTRVGYRYLTGGIACLHTGERPRP